jgi:3D (Asp-Asp-Asp) domain-containing protein/cell division protein FtsB
VLEILRSKNNPLNLTFIIIILTAFLVICIYAESKLSGLGAEVQKLEVALEKSKEENQTLVDINIDLTQRLDKLNQEHQDYRTNIQVHLEKLQSENEVLREDYNSLKSTSDDLKSKNKSLETHKSRLTEENKSLKSRVSSQSTSATVTKVAGVSTPAVTTSTTRDSSPKKSSTSKGQWVATYYNAGVASTGKRPGDRGYGITASGRTVTDGVTVAVDTSVIPLGTWLKITMPDGSVLKRRADDTGSAIKGNKIDIYLNASDSKLMNLGKISGVKVEILN